MLKTKDDIIAALERLRHDQLVRKQHADKNMADLHCLHDLEDTHETNRGYFMSGRCGQSSRIIERYFQTYYPGTPVLSVTAAVQHSVFHCYNLIKDGSGKVYILDLSAAQFFTRPLDAFSGKPYFLGTRSELKSITQAQQAQSWVFLQNILSATNPMQDLREIDIRTRQDELFRQALYKLFNKAAQPCLATEYLSLGFETTWGNQSVSYTGGQNDYKALDWGVDLAAESIPLQDRPHKDELPPRTLILPLLQA